MRASLTAIRPKYLILAGHGDESGIRTADNTVNISWERIAEIICNSGCFQTVVGAKVILFCCKGGIESVSCKLMEVCPEIEFVLGAQKEEDSRNLYGVFSNYFFNCEINSREMSDEDAVHRAQESTEIEIDHFSRLNYKEDNNDYAYNRC